jgi:hypothetical protein
MKLKRLKDFINEELDPKEFANSCVILDDVDCVDDTIG